VSASQVSASQVSPGEVVSAPGAGDDTAPGAEPAPGGEPVPAIVTTGLTKRFRSGQLAVDSLDMLVPRGSVYGFLGPNGSGKTTTIRMLLGLVYPTQGSHALLGVPMPVIMFAAVAACVSFFLRRTRLGTYIYAIGDNPFGARVTGIPTRPVIVLQYVLAALIGAFAGMVMAASVNSMPTRIYNSTLIYDVILVVVLGGIGLSGGRGGVVNVVIGTLLIGTLLNGMTILDVSYSAQNLVKGVILLIAILIDSFLNPRNEETAQQGDI